MNFVNLIWMPYLIGSAVGFQISFRTIQTQGIDPTVSVGDFSNIGEGCIIGANSIIGRFVNIAPYTEIKENSQVGDHSNIGPSCVIGQGVIMSPFTTIGSGDEIGAGCIFNSHVTVGNNAKFKNQAKMYPHSQVADNAEIGHNCTVDSHASIGNSVKMQPNSYAGMHSLIQDNAEIGESCVVDNHAMIGNNATMQPKSEVGMHSSVEDNAEIGQSCVVDNHASIGNSAKMQPKSYIGKHSRVGPQANIGQSAVVHKHVEIPSGETVHENEVIMGAPSSYDLYQNCAGIGNIPSHAVEEADRANNAHGVSPEFNNMLRDMMDDEFDARTQQCNGQPLSQSSSMPHIIALYLIGVHGANGFVENFQRVNQPPVGRFSSGNGFIIIIDGVRLSCPLDPAVEKLQNEMHFLPESPTMLEHDVKKRMIQLLACEEDSKRERRVENDSPCKMFQQIRDGEREVKCANRTQSNINFC